MAVAVDAVSSAATQSGLGVTTFTHTNLTIGASLSNGALIFGVVFDATITSPNAHWDSTGTNQLMTLLGTVSISANAMIALFGLRNPTSGNKTFSTSWTTATSCTVFGISFTGVDQTSNAAAFKNFNSATGTSTAPSVTITSATGDAVVAWFMHDNGSFDFSSLNNTTLYNGSGVNSGAANRAAGAASVAMSSVLTGSDIWGALGVDVAAAVAAGGAPIIPYDVSQGPYRIQRTQIDLSRSLNPNLFKNPIPFGPYDYSLGPRNVTRFLPDASKATNLNLFKNSIPLGPYDYSAGSRRVFDFLPDVSQSLNLNLFKNPIPFGPYDYSAKAYQQMPSLSFTQPYNNNLYSVTITLMGQAWI